MMKYKIYNNLTLDDVICTIRRYNEHNEHVVLDLETTGLNQHTDTITDCILQGNNEPDAIYILKPEHLQELKHLKTPVVAHNFKFDFKLLSKLGINLALKHDTMLLDHLLNENEAHRLDDIVKRRYNDNYKEIFWSRYKNYTDAPKEEQEEYATKDVYYTGRAYRDITEDLQRSEIPTSLMDHARRLALSLIEVEKEGLKLDLPYLAEIGKTLSAQIAEIEPQMRSLVDVECSLIENSEYIKILDSYKTDRGRAKAKPPEPFNFGSAVQLQKLIYDQLKLPIQLNNKRKKTCDDDALQKLEEYHPFIKKLREYRDYKKIYGSFIEGSLEQMTEGRIYPTLNVNGTKTGRLSHSEPNLAQLPSSGGVRGIYIPNPGYLFISADYSMIEVVVAAHYSQDKNLLRMIEEGLSKHDITNEELGLNNRALAKTLNFALQYLCGPDKVAKLMGVCKEEGKVIWTKYWKAYEGERRVIDDCIELVKSNTPITGLFGRKRHFPEFKSLDHWEKESCYRQAYSSKIQGSASDITSEAFYLVNDSLRSKGIGKALFTIHDEIMITAKIEACEEAQYTVKSIMEHVGKKYLSVELKAQVSEPMERWVK